MEEITNDQLAKSLVPNGIKIKLTKIEERSDAEVPNNIKEGEYRIGYVKQQYLKPLLTFSYFIDSVIQRNGESVSPFSYFYTSEVIEIKQTIWDINDPNKWIGCIFKTLNSIYKLEILI